jgi:hypothetical protein
MMSSLYGALRRYATRRMKLDTAAEWGDDGFYTQAQCQQYEASLGKMNEALLDRMGRYYRKNLVVRDAVNGKRSVREAVGEYTMHDDMVLPGTTAVGWKMWRANKNIRGVTGIRDPLNSPILGSDERKIERLRRRAELVDTYLGMFAGDIKGRTGALPNSDEIEYRDSIPDVVNRYVDRLLDMWSRD